MLRHGFKHLNACFDLCQFKPAQRMNPETQAHSDQFRVRVMRGSTMDCPTRTASIWCLQHRPEGAGDRRAPSCPGALAARRQGQVHGGEQLPQGGGALQAGHGPLHQDPGLCRSGHPFRKDLASFVRAYSFLSQILDDGDTELEKRAIWR
jgi:hypothetical protein